MSEGAQKAVDVIIVGAGLSGLVAAESLKSFDKNLNVIVLEAASHIGGRTVASEVAIANGPPAEVDVGGEWILGSQIKLLQLIDRLGLQTFEPAIENGLELKKLVQVGTKSHVRATNAAASSILPSKFGRHTGIRAWFAGLELSYIAWRLDRMCCAFDLINPLNNFGSFGSDLTSPMDFDSMTVDSFLKTKTRFQSVRDIIQIQVELVCGADLNEISLLYLLFYVKSQAPNHPKPFSLFLWGDPDQASPVLRVKNGAFQICRRLAQLVGEDLIMLNQPVQSVTFGHFPAMDDVQEESVYVSTSTGQTFLCSRIIFAVPPTSLRTIEFTPTLPPMKKFLIERMNMGTTIKFYATYDEPYWQEKGFSGEFLSNGGRKTVVTDSGISVEGGPVTWVMDGTCYSKRPMLVGFLSGNLAVEWSQVPEEELRGAILDQLSAIFGYWAREPAGFVIKNWQSDPFASGGPSAYPSVGTMFTYHALRQPFGPIHFAGSETAIHGLGTMYGAVESGLRVSIEVLDEIRPQCLSAQDYTAVKDSSRFGLKRSRNRKTDFAEASFSVLKWTLVLPLVGIGLGCFAYRMCDKYGRLTIPH